jgi:hypothetical protein
MPSLLVVALLMIVSLHGAFGAPSCTNSGSCVAKCKQKHGWPGYSMGHRLGHKTHSPYTQEPSGVVSTPSNGNGNAVKPTDTPTTSPAPASTPSVAVSMSPTSGSSNVSAADISDYLSDHNTLRSKHSAAPLIWNDTLSAYAQKWANNCKFVHSQGPYGGTYLPLEILLWFLMPSTQKTSLLVPVVATILQVLPVTGLVKLVRRIVPTI